MCEQCEIFYCESCRDSFHPMRGPLIKHNLVGSKQGRDMILMKRKIKSTPKIPICMEHQHDCSVSGSGIGHQDGSIGDTNNNRDNRITMYCLVCKCACCSLCVNDNTAHLNHQMQHINTYCKAQKVSISKHIFKTNHTKILRKR